MLAALKEHFGARCSTALAVREQHGRDESPFDVAPPEVVVFAEAVPPPMFREGIGVVVEGTYGADNVFHTRRLMVKHDNQYQPPKAGEVAAAPGDMKKLMQTVEEPK